jgi:hypothetical protein
MAPPSALPPIDPVDACIILYTFFTLGRSESLCFGCWDDISTFPKSDVLVIEFLIFVFSLLVAEGFVSGVTTLMFTLELFVSAFKRFK